MSTTIELGKKVKDNISGLVGVAVCRCEYLHGSPRIGVQPPLSADGKPQDVQWVDEIELTVVDA